MIQTRALALAACLALTAAGDAPAQGAAVAFDGLQQDTSLPVEAEADQLDVSRAEGRAVLTGNVVIGQGAMRLSAARVVIHYGEGATGAGGRISRVEATGDVVLNTGTEAAEAAEALYDIDAGTVVMTGDVVLTQGPNAMSGRRLSVDLTRGTGRMEGRVTTIFQPEEAAE